MLILIGRGLDLRGVLKEKKKPRAMCERSGVRGSGSRRSGGSGSTGSEAGTDLCSFQGTMKKEKRIKFPVAMARGNHLYPYRTQKLSLSALKVLGWKRPGRIGRCRIPRDCAGKVTCAILFFVRKKQAKRCGAGRRLSGRQGSKGQGSVKIWAVVAICTGVSPK